MRVIGCYFYLSLLINQASLVGYRRGNPQNPTKLQKINKCGPLNPTKEETHPSVVLCINWRLKICYKFAIQIDFWNFSSRPFKKLASSLAEGFSLCFPFLLFVIPEFSIYAYRVINGLFDLFRTFAVHAVL